MGKKEHRRIDSNIQKLLLCHSKIGDDTTKSFAEKVGLFQQRPGLELATKEALISFLFILHNHAVGISQIMTLIENSKDTSLKNYLLGPVTDQSVLKELDSLYDELEVITGNRTFR